MNKEKEETVVERAYETRLRIIEKILELMEIRGESGQQIDDLELERMKYHPDTVFLDTDEGVELVAQAIADGHPVVTDYGATYGTAFSVGIRDLIAHVRKEQLPLAVVSLVCTKKVALKWINKNRLHKNIVAAIEKKGIDILDLVSGIAFVRFPCTDEAQTELGEHYVNPDQELQVFIVDNDPLMARLAEKYHIEYVAVRSSNITGKPEEPFVTGAEDYAKEIGAPIFAVRSRKAYQAQLDDHKAISSSAEANARLQRERVGSQPILAFRTNDHGSVIELVRAGNTSPKTMERLLRDFLDDSITFDYKEEKNPAHKRKEYEVSKEITDPLKIKAELLKASLL